MSAHHDGTSYYRATANAHTEFAPLSQKMSTRVVVVGGGFAGLNTALGLAERGVRDVVLLESERVGFGASGRNGGFAFAGYSLGEESLVARVGVERAREMFLRTVRAVELIRARVARYGIACDLVDEGVIWANWFRDARVLRERQAFLAQNFGEEWEWLPQVRLRDLVKSERYTDGLFERNALHFHPLNYAIGIADAARVQGVHVHERSRAIGLERRGTRWVVRTAGGEVEAEQVVLACGGYLAGLERRVDRGVMPIATYVMVTEPVGERLTSCFGTRAAVYDTRFAFDYYRPLVDGRLLWGGRISVRDRSPREVERILYRDMLEVFPQLAGTKVDFAWSGLMSYARHKMPQVGTDGAGLWWAQAFGGHGVSSTAAAGEVVAAAIAENDPGYRAFAEFGLVDSLRPAGFAAAQASYWYYQFKDWWKEHTERAV